MLETTPKAYSQTSVLVASRLEDLIFLRQLGRVSRKSRIQIALPGLDGTRRVEFERLLARYGSACGCNEGSIAGLLYLLLVPLLLLKGWLVPHTLLAKIFVVGGFFGCLIAGKIFGLLFARWRFVRVLKKIERTVA